MTSSRWACTLVLLAACSGEPEPSRSSGIDETKPMLQPDGPLRGLALVAETSPDGSFTDPQLAFSTVDTEATAVVGLGDDIQEGSTLTIAWYRRVGVDGRERLFSHQIAIGPGGYAYSQGVSEAGLAPGVYETVATLGERQVRTPWVVRIATDTASPGGAAGALAFLSAPILAQVGDEDWNVPESGDSGWYDPVAPTEETQPRPGPCEIDQIHPGMNPLRDIKAHVTWVGSCSRMTLTAAVSGAPQTLASREIDESSLLRFLYGDADVCELPGGSDLPGTKVHLAATGSEGASGTNDYTLPDLGEALVAAIEVRPSDGSRVEPGQTIDLHALAMVMAPALGIEELSLRAGAQVIRTTGNLSGSQEPEPCDPGRMLADIMALEGYRVPDSPPPIIEICAEAVGFDGTEADDCAKFYTGEVWEGTYEGDVGYPTCDPALILEGRLTLVVGGDGSVTVEGSDGTTVHSVSSCLGSGSDFTETGLSSVLTGKKTTSGFHIEGGLAGTGWLPGLDLRVTGQRAEGETEFSMGRASTRVTVSLECISCGPLEEP